MIMFRAVVNLLLLCANTVLAQPSPSTVTFLHMNDHHSHFEELSFDIVDPLLIPAALSVESNSIRMFYGGFPRAVALMKQMEEDAVTAGNDVLKVHAGDALTGTVFYTFFGAAVDAAVMNVAKFDAFVIGNHEFDEGDKNLADFLAILEFPAVSFNVNPAEQSPLRELTEASIKPWIIKEISNTERVGICGITIKITTELSSFPDEGTTIADEQASAEACVQELEAEGVNKILMLTHIGYSNDLEWITNIEGVDVVIGGHSHSLLASTDYTQFGFATRSDYAQLINGKCVVSAWEYARVVGELTVSFDEAGVVTACAGAAKMPLNPDKYTVRDADPRFDLSAEDATVMTDFLLALETTPFVIVEPDAETTAVLTPFFAEINTKRLEVIAQAPEAICHTYTEQDPVCPTKVTENWLSGGVCNLVSKGFLLNVLNADVAIQNRGGCRTDIAQGDVSFGDAFNILPFSNTLTTMEMTGEQIRLVLEDALNFFLREDLERGGRGSYPFASGLRYDMDYTAMFGSRISNLEINPRVEGEWAPIDLTMTYTVVTNSFIASGRDGYFTFISDDVASSYIDTFIEYGQSFVNYAQDQQTLVELPLSEYSTQSITLLDSRTFSVTDVLSVSDVETLSPTMAPMASATASPVEKEEDADGATTSWGSSMLTIIALIAVSFAGGL